MLFSFYLYIFYFGTVVFKNTSFPVFIVEGAIQLVYGMGVTKSTDISL